ncbi:cell envelope integrity protein TolA [Falsihalocynthiibacter arcticus]|uniref:TonB C-terminal domain-containing protein n=1 Tax=Falsihalocynthiibacter arcticus TaxID=1579316 RepID=A0A126V292_9RHOB|nr:TonB family protein [Falsihalocynthiibacter arcticus]AML51799.1 hypothetical protein RC74_11440 [Falsihalocynthiibacter arcticus]
MIRSSNTIGIFCFLGAIAAHGAVMVGTSQKTTVEIETGIGAPVTTFGTAFANLAIGVESGEVISVNPAQQPKTAAATMPIRTAALKPKQQALNETAVLQKTMPHISRVSALQAQPTAVAHPQAETPAKPLTTKTIKPTNEPPEAKQQKEPKRIPNKPVPPKAGPKGNNTKENAAAGTLDGQKEAKSATKGVTSSKKNSSGGNAATSNYPGKVFNKIKRAPRKKVNVKGEALVSFEIASNGGLVSVSLARSSGSEALDRAAVSQIKSAAPFPSPPEGARKRYTVSLKGKS